MSSVEGLWPIAAKAHYTKGRTGSHGSKTWSGLELNKFSTDGRMFVAQKPTRMFKAP